MIRTIQVYAEDPLQVDWDDVAEKLADAINNSRNLTRKETKFYILHEWNT